MDKREIANLVLQSITEDPTTPTAWKTHTEEIGRTRLFTTTGYSWTFGDPATEHGFVVHCKLLPYQHSVTDGICQLSVRAKDLSISYQNESLALSCTGNYTLTFVETHDGALPVPIRGLLRLIEEGLQVAVR